MAWDRTVGYASPPHGGGASGASHEYCRPALVAVPRAGLVHPAAGSAGQRRGQSDLARPQAPATIMVAAAGRLRSCRRTGRRCCICGRARWASLLESARPPVTCRQMVQCPMSEPTRHASSRPLSASRSPNRRGCQEWPGCSAPTAPSRPRCSTRPSPTATGFRFCGPRQPRSMIRRRPHRPFASIESMPASSSWGSVRRPRATSTVRPWCCCQPTSVPGSQWSGAGSAGDTLDYRSELQRRSRQR